MRFNLYWSAKRDNQINIRVLIDVKKNAQNRVVIDN